MKIYNTISLFFLCAWSFSQTITTESITRLEGVPSMFAKMGETKSKTFYYKGKTLIVTEMQNSKATTLLTDDSVTYVNGKDCYTDSKKNFDDINNKGVVYEDVEVAKNNGTKNIIGYKCNSATISFKVKNGPLSTKQTMIAWYSPDLKDYFSGMIPTSAAENENPLSKVLAALDGMVLQTETNAGTFTTISEITKVEKIEFKGEQFSINTKKCKKMLTYKEFAEEMNKRDARSHNGGFSSFPR